MRIKECKEWDKLPTAIQEILLENQRLINQHLLELEDEKEVVVCGFDSLDRDGVSNGLPDVATTNSKFSKAKEKAGVRKDANIE